MKLDPTITAALIGVFGGLVIALTQIYLPSIEKQTNKAIKQETCLESSNGIHIEGSTISGGVGNHRGDNFYGTKREDNFNKKEKKCESH